MNSIFKSILLANVLIFSLSTAVAFAAETSNDQDWQVRGRSETTLEWHEVIGTSGSGIDEGSHWLQNLSIDLSKKLKKGKMGLDLRGRATDDKQIDNRDARLMYMRGYLDWENFSLEVGDVAASFNPFVFSGGAKGGKVGYTLGTYDKGWDFSFLSGVQKASWEEVYDSTSDNSVDRYIAGFNTEWKYAPAQNISASFSWVNDDNSSIPTEAATSAPVEAKTVGVDWDWRFNRYISLKGETAYTKTDSDTDDSNGSDDATAIRVKLSTKPIPRSVRSSFLYERLGSDFNPIVASASSDRERYENDTEWMVNRQVKLRLTMKHSRDNLDGDLGDTLVTRDGVFYITYRPDWLKRSDFGIRSQLKDSNGRGTDQRLFIGEIDFNFRPKSGWRYGASWITTNIDNNAAGGEEQQVNTVRGTIGWKKRLSSDHLVRASVRLDGNFINRDSGDSRSMGGKVDFGYDAGNLWSTDLSASTKNSDTDGVDADNTYISYQLRANYHPGEDRSKAIRLTVERREYAYDDVTADDYQEHIAKLSYLFSF